MPRIASILSLLMTSPCLAQLANYDAGTAGSPATAPDPVTQGWTLVDPSGGQVTLSGLSPDPGTLMNAWSLDDAVTFTGGRAHYAQLFTPSENAAVSASGWSLSFEARLVSTNGANVFCEYATGTTAADDRYLVFYTVSGTDVVANVLLSGVSYVCPGGNDGGYHEYTIQKPAGASTVDARLFFDGVAVGNIPREDSNPNAPDGGVHWGTGSSAATAIVNVHRVDFGLAGGNLIGNNYCTANVNSSGVAGAISAVGSTTASDNDVTLRVHNLPASTFGIFIVSQVQDQTPLVDGFLCLGGTIGRYSRPGEIFQVDASGSASHVIDLTEIPQAGMTVAAIGGETWNFQSWHRDLIGGAVSANLTNGLAIDFQ